MGLRNDAAGVFVIVPASDRPKGEGKLKEKKDIDLYITFDQMVRRICRQEWRDIRTRHIQQSDLTLFLRSKLSLPICVQQAEKKARMY